MLKYILWIVQNHDLYIIIHTLNTCGKLYIHKYFNCHKNIFCQIISELRRFMLVLVLQTILVMHRYEILPIIQYCISITSRY